jgi:hypothetical protein
MGFQSEIYYLMGVSISQAHIILPEIYSYISFSGSLHMKVIYQTCKLQKWESSLLKLN